MGLGNRYPQLDPQTVTIVKHRSHMLMGYVGFLESDIEDLEQELMYAVFRGLKAFDASRSSRRTFINRIVENATKTIIERRTTAKRNYGKLSLSWEDLLEREKLFPAHGQSDHEFDLGFLQATPWAFSDDFALSTDVRRTVSRLPSKHRQLCLRLIENRPAEISREMSVAQSTIHNWTMKLRESFNEAGLHVYV